MNKKCTTTPFDTIYQTQNVIIAQVVLQVLEDNQIIVPEKIGEKVMEVARKMGDKGQGEYFKERLKEAAQSS